MRSPQPRRPALSCARPPRRPAPRSRATSAKPHHQRQPPSCPRGNRPCRATPASLRSISSAQHLQPWPGGACGASAPNCGPFVAHLARSHPGHTRAAFSGTYSSHSTHGLAKTAWLRAPANCSLRARVERGWFGLRSNFYKRTSARPARTPTFGCVVGGHDPFVWSCCLRFSGQEERKRAKLPVRERRPARVLRRSLRQLTPSERRTIFPGSRSTSTLPGRRARTRST